jgi:energy-coupling factor transporter transmembrane protein EcfT
MSKKEKKQLTPEQIYKKNQKKSKIFKRLAPIIFWIFIGLAILFFVFTIKNSVGNITEIIHLLDKDVYNREQIAEHYAMLVEKYGEWTVIGAEGSAMTMQFVNIKNALFRGLMITFLSFTIVCFIAAMILGKILFPKLALYYSENNQDMVISQLCKQMQK